jgi:ATP adenylyltransferase
VKRMFAPWRHAYVTEKSKSAGCVLCGAQERGEAEKLVVHVGERNFVVMNLFPYNPGHVMVAPKRHVGSLTDALPEELAEMMALARRLEGVFQDLYKPDGINVGMNLGRAAGAGVADHIHLHLVPRWNGDTNFISVVGETRVIPEDPAVASARLRERFRA